MTQIKEVAALLDGREIYHEMSQEVKVAVEGQGIAIVFGASDDLMEFRGAIDDELGCNDGGLAYLDDKGLLVNKCDDDGCPHFKAEIEKAVTIEAVWCPDESVEGLEAVVDERISWAYKTAIPHETFRIMEDGEIYCRGIVFDMEDLASIYLHGVETQQPATNESEAGE